MGCHLALLAHDVGACVIASWSFALIRDTSAILLDMNPDRRMTDNIRSAIESEGDQLADLHLWRLGPGHLARPLLGRKPWAGASGKAPSSTSALRARRASAGGPRPSGRPSWSAPVAAGKRAPALRKPASARFRPRTCNEQWRSKKAIVSVVTPTDRRESFYRAKLGRFRSLSRLTIEIKHAA
jgi:hypothetical protein